MADKRPIVFSKPDIRRDKLGTAGIRQITIRSCRSVGLLERLQVQFESGHSMLFEIRKPECVL